MNKILDKLLTKLIKSQDGITHMNEKGNTFTDKTKKLILERGVIVKNIHELFAEAEPDTCPECDSPDWISSSNSYKCITCGRKWFEQV